MHVSFQLFDCSNWIHLLLIIRREYKWRTSGPYLGLCELFYNLPCIMCVFSQLSTCCHWWPRQKKRFPFARPLHHWCPVCTFSSLHVTWSVRVCCLCRCLSYWKTDLTCIYSVTSRSLFFFEHLTVSLDQRSCHSLLDVVCRLGEVLNRPSKFPLLSNLVLYRDLELRQVRSKRHRSFDPRFCVVSLPRQSCAQTDSVLTYAWTPETMSLEIVSRAAS